MIIPNSRRDGYLASLLLECHRPVEFGFGGQGTVVLVIPRAPILLVLQPVAETVCGTPSDHGAVPPPEVILHLSCDANGTSLVVDAGVFQRRPEHHAVPSGYFSMYALAQVACTYQQPAVLVVIILAARPLLVEERIALEIAVELVCDFHL